LRAKYTARALGKTRKSQLCFNIRTHEQTGFLECRLCDAMLVLSMCHTARECRKKKDKNTRAFTQCALINDCCVVLIIPNQLFDPNQDEKQDKKAAPGVTI
jgi:hypothetical protein